MEQYVKTHELSVDPILHDFINAEALPGTDVDASRFGRPWRRLSISLHCKINRCWQSAMRCKARSTPGMPNVAGMRWTWMLTGPSCRRSAIWCPRAVTFAVSDGECRSRAVGDRGAPACRAVDECALCTERGKRALGRSTMHSTERTRFRRRAAPSGAVRSIPLRARSRLCAQPPRFGGAACRRVAPGFHRLYALKTANLSWNLAGGKSHRLSQSGEVRRICGRRRERRRPS